MEGGEGGDDFFIILEVCRERGGWREERVGRTSSSSLRCVEREGVEGGEGGEDFFIILEVCRERGVEGGEGLGRKRDGWERNSGKRGRWVGGVK